MCSDSEAGSYLTLIDFVYHSTLGLRVIKKKRREVPLDGTLPRPTPPGAEADACEPSVARSDVGCTCHPSSPYLVSIHNS